MAKPPKTKAAPKKTQEQVHAEAAMDELVALTQELYDAPTTSQEATVEPMETLAEESNTVVTPEAVNAPESILEPSTTFAEQSDTFANLSEGYEAPLQYATLDGRVTFVVEHPDLHHFTDLVLKASRFGAEILPNTVPEMYGTPKLAAVSISEGNFNGFLNVYHNNQLSGTDIANGSTSRLISISTHDPLAYVGNLLRFGAVGARLAEGTVSATFINNFSYTTYLVVGAEFVKDINDPYILVY